MPCSRCNDPVPSDCGTLECPNAPPYVVAAVQMEMKKEEPLSDPMRDIVARVVYVCRAIFTYDGAGYNAQPFSVNHDKLVHAQRLIAEARKWNSTRQLYRAAAIMLREIDRELDKNATYRRTRRMHQQLESTQSTTYRSTGIVPVDGPSFHIQVLGDQ